MTCVGSISRVLAAGAVVAGALVAGAAPASAETGVEVEAGHADGHTRPYEPLPVRVTVTSDQLVRGSLRVAVEGRDTAEAVTVPVEVPGGSAKEVVVALPAVPVGMAATSVTATFSGDGIEAAGSHDVITAFETELVGLLPGATADAPEVVEMAADLGTARFAELDEALLAAPGGLGGLGTVVAPGGGLSGLDGVAVAHVLDWVDQGGRLVVDAPPGTPVDGVPADWQPGDASRAPAGLGEVALSDGAAAAGRWGDVIAPTPLIGAQSYLFNSFQQEGVGDSIARDAGLRTPELGWLLAFLAAYVTLAGPVAFLVLRRIGRPGWAWAAIPALAVGFTAVAFVAGNDLRTGSRAAHASIVETGPFGARALTHVGVVSRAGGDGEVRFGEGWGASGLVEAMGFSDDGMPGTDAGGTIDVASDGTRPTARIGLEAGGFGVVTGDGPVDGPAGLAVTATAAADGALAGTVTNGTDLALEEAIVLVGDRVVGVGTLGPGAEAEWSIAAADAGQMDPWSPVETPWDDAIGWQDGSPDLDGVVNYTTWADARARHPDPVAPGIALVAGWTRDWAPPVEVRGEPVTGRTAVVARAPVTTAEPGTAPSDAIRRVLVRGPEGAGLPEGMAADGEFGPAEGQVLRFLLPEGAGADPALEVFAPAGLRGAEVWDGSAWVPITLQPADLDGDPAAAGASGGGSVSVRIAGPGQPAPGAPMPPPVGLGDPFDPMARVAGALPPGAVRGGAVLLRAAVINDGTAVDVRLRAST